MLTSDTAEQTTLSGELGYLVACELRCQMSELLWESKRELQHAPLEFNDCSMVSCVIVDIIFFVALLVLGSRAFDCQATYNNDIGRKLTARDRPS